MGNVKTQVPSWLVSSYRASVDFADQLSRADPLTSKDVPVSVGAILQAHKESDVVKQKLQVFKDDKEHANYVVIIAALASWRRTQFIYRYDDALLDALCETSTDVRLDRSILSRLPAPCVWIDGPKPNHGFFALLDRVSKDEGLGFSSVLWLVTVVPMGDDVYDADFGNPDAPNIGMRAVVLPLDMSLDASVERAYSYFPEDEKANIARCVAGCVSALLYLCSEEPEIDGQMGRLNRQRVARRQAPYSPTVFEVGARFGAAFRKAVQEHQEGTQNGEGHRSPIPHFRRAHWHSYWLGPRDKPDLRRKVLKWLPPIAVNVKEGEEHQAVVRKVEP